MIRALWFGLLALAAFTAAPAAAAARLFSEDAPLTIVITGPFNELVRKAKTNKDPYPATLTVRDGGGPVETLKIQIRARGLFRRTSGSCAFPPIGLDFGKQAPKGSLFHGDGKLKLVTYCRTGSDYEQRIIMEHLSYKLYNLMTPLSYRVRAAQVTYRNAEGDAGVTRFGFLIEDTDDVAARNGMAELEAMTGQVRSSQLDPRATARAALFEFMIGNVDWAFLAAPPGEKCCHNSYFLAAKGATPATAAGVVPVPYDWDWSGFINPPYATVPPTLPISRVTERLYRGYCVSNGAIPAAIDEYRARKAELLALVSNETRLEPAYRDRGRRFLEGFFEVIDDPDRVQSQIIKRCR